MNGKERILAAARGAEPDRLPVMLYMGNHGTLAAGGRLADCCRDGRLLAEAQLRALELYGKDAVFAQSDNYYMAEAFGARVEFRDAGLPALVGPTITDLADIARLTVKDPLRDGRMHVYIEAVDQLVRRVGGDVAIRGCGTGPFVLAGHLLGLEPLLLTLLDAAAGDAAAGQAIRDLLEIGRETLLAFARLQLEAGASVVQLADSTASLNLISPALYEEWVFPVERRFFSDLAPLCRRYGAVSLLHICGDNTKVLELYARTGADIVEIDHAVDLAVAKRALTGRAAIAGNLDPSGLLLQGTPETIRMAVADCVAKAGCGGGYILGSGCEVPVDAPAANVRAAIAAGRSWYGDGSPAGPVQPLAGTGAGTGAGA